MNLTSSFKVTQLTEAAPINPVMAQTAFNSQLVDSTYIGHLEEAKQSSGFQMQSSSTFANPSEVKKDRNISPES